MFPTHLTSAFLGYSNRPQAEGKSIEKEQLPRNVAADAGDLPDREEGRKCPDYPAYRSQDSTFSAVVAVVIVEGVADEASITGLVLLPAAEEGDLPLELRGGRGHESNVEARRGVRHDEPCREIVAPVDNNVVTGEDVRRIGHVQTCLDGYCVDLRIQLFGEVRSKDGLGLAKLVISKQPLALQVGGVDDIVVDDAQMTYSGSGEGGDECTTNTSSAYHEHARCLQAALADAAQLRQDDLARVSLKLVVG